MKKKILSAFLAAVMIGTLPLPAASAQEEGTPARAIESVQSPSSFTVPYGSTEENVLGRLPGRVTATLADDGSGTPSQPLFTDNFSSAAESAAKWTLFDPDRAVKFEDGKVSVGASKNLKLAAGDAGWTDYVVEADVSGPGSPYNNFGVMFRSTDITAANADSYKGYYAGVGYSGGLEGNALCIGYADGAWHDLQLIPLDYQAGKTYRLKVVAYRSTMTVFLDGVKKHQWTDTLFSKGQAGLRSYNQPFSSTFFSVRTVDRADLAECGISPGESVSADISGWTCENYDGQTPGTYTFTGTIAPSESYANPNGITAAAEVTVNRMPPEPGTTPQAVDFTKVHIDDAFWSTRQKQFICEVIPTGIRNVEKATGGIPNIVNAAKKNRGAAYGAFQGALYVDSDVHKVLESMCYALQIDPKGDQEVIAGQEAIRKKLNEWIPYYVDAQESNGYFDTYFTLGASSKEKFSDFNLHELYCAGHFYEAAVAHYRATGGTDDRLLKVAVKSADYIDSLFGPGKWKQVPGHQEIELALIRLAQLCREIGGEYAAKADRYVALARFFLDTRGDYEGRHGTNHNNSYDQDHLPVEEQTSAVGHAVRAQYMYTAMADVALLEGFHGYDNALLSLWDDVTNRKSYVTGGIGSNPSIEGFGEAYDLPNDSAYCETCANIANVMWNQRMSLLYGQSKYADVMERALYNSVISGVNFGGDRFFYGNPMSSSGTERSVWFGTACCPPNLMRTVEAIGSYIYTQKADEITLNLYIGNETELNLGGSRVGLKLSTEMPWEGASTLTVAAAQPKEFTLRLRIPSWAGNGNTIQLNGDSISAEPDENGYVSLRRTWSDGDRIEVNFPMSIERTHTDPKVKNNVGYTAVQRGPVVYAAEGADNPFSFRFAYLPQDAPLKAERVENLDGKADPYQIKSLVRITAPGKLRTPDGEQDVTWTLIPYYAWANRGKNPMTVYLSEQPKDETALEALATPSAAYTYGTDSVNGLNDGADSRWTAYSYGQLNPWVQYDFDREVTLWGCDVKWYDDNGGVQIPDGLTIQYWNGTEFVPVQPTEPYKTFLKNKFYSYPFQPVNTSKIRMVIRNDQRKIAPGIMEWKLQGSAQKVDLSEVPLSGIRYGDLDYGTAYNRFNAATFAPAVSDKFRLVTQSAMPVGLTEFMLKTADGTNVAPNARLTASFTCEPYSELSAVNNGYWEESSVVGGATESWSTWPEAGENGVQWVQFDFDEPQAVSRAEAFWYRAWDDGVVKPDSWKLQYFADGQWKDVTHRMNSLEEFDNAKTEYEVSLPYGSAVPSVTPDSAFPFADISVKQPASLPGTAEVTVKSADGSGSSRTYTISFTEEPKYRADLEQLKELIASCEKLDSERFTADSWADFQAALQNAEIVAAKPDAEASEISEAFSRLALSVDHLVYGTEKSLLATVIGIAKNTDTTGCTAASVRVLTEALARAETLLNQPDASQEQVDAAVRDLMQAMINLADRMVNTADLEKMVQTAEQLSREKYTSSSWNSLQAALEQAKSVLAGGTAEQEEIDRAYRKLAGAVTGLILRANTVSLELAIQIAQQIADDIDQYAPQSVSGLEERLAAAKAVLANADASQREVDAAAKQLAEQAAKARKKANKKPLQAMVGKIRSLKLELYTPQTVQPLNELLSAADTMLLDGNAAQKDADALAARLQSAVSALEPKNTAAEDASSGGSGSSSGPDVSSEPGGASSSEASSPRTGEMAIPLLSFVLLAALGCTLSLLKIRREAKRDQESEP